MLPLSPYNEIHFRRLFIALTIYITSLFAANTLGMKLMPFFFGGHMSVGVFAFPIVFLMTDVVGEVYGKVAARWFVIAGTISMVLWVAYSFLSLVMPWSPDGAWAQSGYDTVFGLSVRMTIASLVAYTVGEYQDVVSFFFFRERLHIGPLWIRSALSNVYSQFFDAALFLLIAFGGVYSWGTLTAAIITLWITKVLIGLLYTPLLYAGIYLFTRSTWKPEPSQPVSSIQENRS